MKARLIILSLVMIAVALAATLTVFAAIPHVMNYQGKATDKAGAPLNGAYSLTFRIYNSETGGSLKWSETQPNIPISNGIFQVQLGSVTPLNLSFDEPCWISIEINTDGEMTPRTRLASVPYAYRAESLADTPVIPFYNKGFDIKYVDINSVKITPGVMDVAGKMFTTTAYSNLLQLAYLDNPANKDWVHGQKTNNSTVYVYAYNNSGQVAFKFSDEAPDLSDQYGNVAGKPFLYQRYPDTSSGIYYRNIGKVNINTSGALTTTDSSTDGVPAGAVMAWAAANPPDGWLLCDGSAVSRTEYAKLFGAIGTTYGSGDGSSTFNLPNLKGKIPVGYNSAEAEFNALAKTGGEKAHALSNAELATHSHGERAAGAALYSAFGGGSGPMGYQIDPTYNHVLKYGFTNYDAPPAYREITDTAGSGTAHNNLQPYTTLIYIIKAL